MNATQQLLQIAGRTEGKVDELLKDRDDHAKRIRDLEKSRNHLKGALAVITTMFAGLWAYIKGG